MKVEDIRLMRKEDQWPDFYNSDVLKEQLMHAKVTNELGNLSIL